jgi:hypothetical protein
LVKVKIDVRRVLFLQPIVKGHAFHDKERDHRRHPDLRLIAATLRQFAFDVGFDVEIKCQIAAAGLARAPLLHQLRPMLWACAIIFARQKVNLNFDRVALHGHSAMKDE